MLYLQLHSLKILEIKSKSLLKHSLKARNQISNILVNFVQPAYFKEIFYFLFVSNQPFKLWVCQTINEILPSNRIKHNAGHTQRCLHLYQTQINSEISSNSSSNFINKPLAHRKNSDKSWHFIHLDILATKLLRAWMSTRS